jgi:drug/metabolite transporter (DMT)-like permease
MKNEQRAFAYAIAAVLLWSTVATAFKITLTHFSPTQMVAAASLFSALSLLAVCAWQGKLSLIGKTFSANPLFFVLLGLINPLCYYLILFKAYELLPASQAQPINYSWAITLTLMAAAFLKQKIRPQDWIACALGYIGVLVIATQGDLISLEFDSPLGVGLALLSTLLWSGYWILNTKNKADPVVGVLLGFLVALAPAFGLAWYEGLNWPTAPSAWLAVSYVGLFEMGITFVLWISAMKLTSNTARISNLIFVSPFISLLLLATIIGEAIHPSTVVGLGLIVTGLLIQQLAKTRQA